MASQERNAYCERRLFQYVIEGKTRKIQKILEKEQSIAVDITNNKGQTLLYVSCLYRKLKVAIALLQFGADPNKRCHDGSTPTHAAAYSCSPELLRSMVENFGGDMRLHDYQMRTPKDWAIRAGKSANKKTIQLIETWQKKVIKKIDSKKRYMELSLADSQSRSSELLKSNLKIEYCGYGSFLRCLDRSAQDRYFGIPAVLPLASPSNLSSPDNLSLVIKAPPGFIIEEAAWCGHKVIVKRSHGKSRSVTQATEDLLISEARASRHLHHPNLLLLMAMCVTSSKVSYTEGSSLWLVYEPTTLGSLHHVLHETEMVIPPAQAANFMIRIGDALSYLHSRGFVHCAFSSHGVYLTESLHAKLGDLFYIHCTGEKLETPLPFSSNLNRWFSPEVVLKGSVCPATDVYGFCTVVTEALSSSLPWYGCDNTSIDNHIRNRRNYFLLPDWFPKTLTSVLGKGLRFHSHNRAVTIKDVSICLKTLVEKGELRNIVTKVQEDEIVEFSPGRDDFFCSKPPKPNTSHLQLNASHGSSNDAMKNISDDTYITAGIDVPEAGPLCSTTPKESGVEALSCHIASELREQIQSKDSSGLEATARPCSSSKLCSANPLTSRPHSCSIITQDGLVREVLLSAARHNSFPDMRDDCTSCILPPRYEPNMVLHNDCNMEVEKITSSRSEETTCFEKVVACQPLSELSDERIDSNNMVKDLAVRGEEGARCTSQDVLCPGNINTADKNLSAHDAEARDMVAANFGCIPELATPFEGASNHAAISPYKTESAMISQETEIKIPLHDKMLQNSVDEHNRHRLLVRNSQKVQSFPLLPSIHSKTYSVRGPPRRSYTPDHLSECFRAPLTVPCYLEGKTSDVLDGLRLNKTSGKEASNVHRVWTKPSKKPMVSSCTCDSDQNKDVPDSVPCRIQRTVSYPGKTRVVASSGRSQMLSSAKLPKLKPSNSFDYGDFNVEEKFNIETEDLEEIFGSFAQRRNRNENGITVPQDQKNETASGIFQNKASQTDGQGSRYVSSSKIEKLYGAQELLEQSCSKLHLGNVDASTMFPDHYGTDAGTQTILIDHTTRPAVGEVLPGDAIINETPAKRSESDPCERIIGLENAAIEQKFGRESRPTPKNRKLSESKESDNPILVCSDIAGGVSVFSPRELLCQNIDQASKLIEGQPEQSMASGFVTCTEINETDIDSCKNVPRPLVLTGEKEYGAEQEGTTGKEESAMRAVISSQVTEAGESGYAQVNMDTSVEKLSIEVLQKEAYRLPSASELRGAGLLKGSHTEEKKGTETPSKWSFQKKLCLFKVVADKGKDTKVSPKVVLKNSTLSKVQRAVEEFDTEAAYPSQEQDSIGNTGMESNPCKMNHVQNFYIEESADDSCGDVNTNRILQDKACDACTFKTSTPVSQHQQPVKSLVKCKDAVTPRSFEEVRAEIEAASISKCSQFEESSQNLSEVTSDCKRNHSLISEEFFGDSKNSAEQEDMKNSMQLSGLTTSFYTEPSGNTYHQPQNYHHNLEEIRKMVRHAIKDIIESAIALVERNLTPKAPACSAGVDSLTYDNRNINGDFCVDQDNFTNAGESENGEETTDDDSEIAPGRENLKKEQVQQGTHQKPLKTENSAPLKLDRPGDGLMVGLTSTHSDPEQVSTFHCAAEGDEQECSSFTSEGDEPQTSKFYRSIDTSVWSV